MILQALNSYYERLADDPNVNVAPFGYSRQKISFCVVLNKDGSLHEVRDERIQEGKKQVPLSLVVPGNAKPSGSGINPCFLWDNPAYMLGYKPGDAKPERTQESFEAFRTRHCDAEAAVDDQEFSAVCTFLKNWNPDTAADHATLVDIGTGFGIFRMRGADHYVHERPAVKEWWDAQLEADDDTEDLSQCLVTGERRPIARLHEPKIKGVWGGQSSGASIVSFNLDSFESYGKSQSHNAPVGERAAFQYCTALNRLLADDGHRVQIGDASTVVWTEQPTQGESLLPWFIEPSRKAEDAEQTQKVYALLKQIAEGDYPSELGDPETPFYVLGLSPNAARISVRFWWVSTLGDLIVNIRQHYADLAIIHSDRDPDFPPLWRLLRETVRDSKDLPPLLGGAVTRAVLTGTPYPEALFTSVIRRIRVDRQMNSVRAGILKGCLNRHLRLNRGRLESPVEFDLEPDRPEVAYQLGRLFAVIEKIEQDAFPKRPGKIRERYLANASALPAATFPQALRLSMHHLSKYAQRPDWTKDEAARFRRYMEVELWSIAHELNGFPTTSDPQSQALFMVGYHHQNRRLWTPKATESTQPKENVEP